MPNLVYQHLEIQCGCHQEALEFMQSKDSAFDFNEAIEMPDSLAGLPNPISEKWSRDNWGTKWNAVNVQVPCFDEGFSCIKYDTAWDLPIPVLCQLSDMYPECKLSLYYVEDGWSFAGIDRFKQGIHIADRFAPESNFQRFREVCGFVFR